MHHALNELVTFSNQQRTCIEHLSSIEIDAFLRIAVYWTDMPTNGTPCLVSFEDGNISE